MPLADELVNHETAKALARALEAAAPPRRMTGVRAAGRTLTPLPLRARADALRDAVLADIPGDLPELATVVRAALAGDTPFDGWMMWPVSTAVAERALADDTTDAFDDGMALLAELTPRLSSEFAIRWMLRHDLDRALTTIRTWPADPDPAVRRLASEGTRAYLPWAIRVPALLRQPEVTVPILDALYRDPDPVVRRSVANHLNDLSRDHAELVVVTARHWLQAADENTPATVRHALRTLIKRGHPEALALLGFREVTVTVDGPVIDLPVIPYGGSVTFTASIRNDGTEAARLAVDYAVHHRKANGSTVAKVFKLTTKNLEPGEVLTVTKTHSLRPITTRRYYPGSHAVDLRVNGISSAPTEFELLPN